MKRAELGGTFFNGLVRKDSTVKVTCQQTPKGAEGEGRGLSGGGGRQNNSKASLSRP